MKIGLVCRPDRLDNVPEYDNYNYINFIVQDFRKRHDLYLFDWRNLNENLSAEGIIANKKGFEEKYFSLNDCDLVFIKQLGKIHKEQESFLNFLNILDNYSGKILNDTNTIRSNLSKQYLLDLYEEDFPVIPTKKFNKKFGLDQARQISFNKNIESLVIKPLVFGEQGQSVRQLESFENNYEFEEYKKRNGDLIIQPLIKSIFKNGERSLVYLGKEFAHAVSKYSGKFKINATLNTIYKKHNPTQEELKICNEVLDFWPNKLGYTRIDLIFNGEKYLISEIETINPAFYIENVPGLGKEFLPKLEEFLVGKNEK